MAIRWLARENDQDIRVAFPFYDSRPNPAKPERKDSKSHILSYRFLWFRNILWISSEPSRHQQEQPRTNPRCWRTKRKTGLRVGVGRAAAQLRPPFFNLQTQVGGRLRTRQMTALHRKHTATQSSFHTKFHPRRK